MRRISMWWHRTVLDHRSRTGGWSRHPGDKTTHFYSRCQCGQYWTWSTK